MAEEAHAGAIIADINSRRGRIEGMEPHVGLLEITARVPLSEMLRSSKHGRPEYPMQFAGYQETPHPYDGFGGSEEAPSPRDDLGEGGAGVTANKPTRPRVGSGRSAAKLDDEFDSF